MALRVVISNAYSSLNKGDSAILLVLLNTLLKIDPKVEICIVSCTPQIDREAYAPYHGRVIGGPVEISSSGQFRRMLAALWMSLNLGIWMIFLRHFRRSSTVLRRLSQRAGDFSEAFERSDIVISCGGGFLSSNTGPSVYGHLLQLLFAVVLAKPTFVYSQSIGPFRGKLVGLLCRAVLDRIHVILVREDMSLQWLREIRVQRPKIHVTADAALLLPESTTSILESLQVAGGTKKVGLTVRNWSFPGSHNRVELRAKYFDSLAKLVRHLVSQGVSVVFIPQVIVPKVDDDRDAMAEVIRLAGVASGVHILTSDFQPPVLKSLIGDLDCFVGTRMHSNIFALSQGVPTLAIAYEFKTQALMRQFGVESWVLEIEDVDSRTLVSRLDDLLASTEEYRRALAAKLDYALERANQNEVYLREFINSHVASNNCG